MIPELTPGQFVIVLIIVGIVICVVVAQICDLFVKIAFAKYHVHEVKSEDERRATEA